MRDRTSRASAICLALLGTGCGPEDPPDATMSVVRDSAGIRIVASSEPAWRNDRAWTVGEAPRLRIGTAEGDPRYQLYRVRDAALIGDARVVVANEGSHEIRFYGREGRHLFTVGGEGEGPREFRFLTWLEAIGDSLYVYDRGDQRVSVLTSEGRVARSWTLSGAGDLPVVRPLGAFADRTLLARAFTSAYFVPEDGVRRDLDLYLRIAPTGGVLDARLPGNEHDLQARENGLVDMRVPFARGALVTVAPDGFYFGTSATYEIARYTPEGRLGQVIRLARDPRPVTPEALEQLLAAYQDDAPNDDARRGVAAWLRSVPAPATMPAYSDLRHDDAGNLWVERYRAPFERERAPRWSVFDPGGRFLGTVTLPPGFTPFEIGTDFVLGRRVDELEIELVELYELRKP